MGFAVLSSVTDYCEEPSEHINKVILLKTTNLTIKGD